MKECFSYCFTCNSNQIHRQKNNKWKCVNCDANKWGGRRDGAGPPRKMVEPIRVTISLEANDLEILRAKYGRYDWQNIVRQLINDHINSNIHLP